MDIELDLGIGGVIAGEFVPDIGQTGIRLMLFLWEDIFPLPAFLEEKADEVEVTVHRGEMEDRLVTSFFEGITFDDGLIIDGEV